MTNISIYAIDITQYKTLTVVKSIFISRGSII